MTEHLRVEAVGEHHLRSATPEPKGPKSPAKVSSRQHAYVRRFDPRLRDRVEEPSAVTKRSDEDVESSRLEARGEDRQLSLGAADRECGEEDE